MILSKKYQGGAVVGIFFLTKLLKLQKKTSKMSKNKFFKRQNTNKYEKSLINKTKIRCY